MNWELIITLAIGAGVPIGALVFMYVATRRVLRKSNDHHMHKV